MNFKIKEKFTAGENTGLIIGIPVLLIAAVALTAFLWILAWEPSGLDVWGHIFKSEIMYEEMKEGNLYPLYTPLWYNGIQLYRYWPPMTYYLMALLQFITGGNIIYAYYLFAGVVVFFGGLPFVLLGNRVNKPVVGTVCGLLWFALPDNIRVFFVEGNMPRIMTSLLIPYVMYFLWRYIRENKRAALIGLMLSMTFLTFTHLMLTAITGIGTFLFLVFDWIQNRNFRRDAEALAAMVAGILIAGIWFVPAMFGGMLSMGDSSSDTQDLLTFALSDSLDFMNRVSGDAEIYYYGLSVLVVAVLGILLAKNNKAGFVLAIVVLLGTTPATVSVTKHLPLGEFLWMTRFTALSYAFFMLSLLEWKTLRRKYAILLTLLLVVDSGVTLGYLSRYYTPALDEAKTDGKILKDMTTQRTSVMDLSMYGCYLSWELVTGEDAVDYTFGWAWQGASTAENIMLMNEALEREEYAYMFDRNIELGNDTVLVMHSKVQDEDKLLVSAENCGYQLENTSDTGYFFKKNTPESFGVKTEYLGLTIGEYAGTLSIYYPTFMIGKSDYVDDYTVEELKEYKTIFLSGFQYHNQENAEEIIRKAADAGVRIVIDCAHIPEDGLKQHRFLDMLQNQITFEDNFPNLFYENGAIIAGNIPTEDGAWKTGYVNNMDHVLGYVEVGNQKIPFLGYNDGEDNIVYLGLNLVYFAMNSGNTDIWDMLNDSFLLNYNQLPNRELVPITITMEKNEIIIESEQENVNTTLAYQDNFETGQKIYEENHLLVAGDQYVKIKLVYPHFTAGLLVSFFGIILGIGIMIETKMKKDE